MHVRVCDAKRPVNTNVNYFLLYFLQTSRSISAAAAEPVQFGLLVRFNLLLSPFVQASFVACVIEICNLAIWLVDRYQHPPTQQHLRLARPSQFSQPSQPSFCQLVNCCDLFHVTFKCVIYWHGNCQLKVKQSKLLVNGAFESQPPPNIVSVNLSSVRLPLQCFNSTNAHLVLSNLHFKH